MEKKIESLIRDYYQSNGDIPLHAPIFQGNEKAYTTQAIDSTFVSSVGVFVNEFENKIATYTNSQSAVATVNGTAALHASLVLSGVKSGDYVISQALTFVATCNAITYLEAEPIFIDVDIETLGLSPIALVNWLNENAEIRDSNCIYKKNGRKIAACVPMHTFGHPCKIDEIQKICYDWKIELVEDAAESLGSFYKGQHTGTFARFGTLSFNGNKIITTGGGGMILSKLEDGKLAKHITTTAKVPHKYDFFHDQIGYNYRMPNLNAALGLAQLEQLESFLIQKRHLATIYETFFKGTEFTFIKEPTHAKSNYWLNAILCENEEKKKHLLITLNQSGIFCRPAWKLMSSLPMFQNCISDGLRNSKWIEERLVNLPSSVK
ncbi:UDP-bacillosamine synthetase [Leptospira ryugenii]|uniref:UDP-bacillosamine synthetase n=1 Tax=Leptospira ryugenii TaxID=1917863 RepID=A0A2P2DW60_9LEPT|nr:LegC family aminotransferase [Leptospira ryugenii]GBF48800.1 UDP-bacillosamine synthetase [Leptospira ryugenii]